ncbi:hypothetical protein PCNPT3_11565 [Psychromonas sp. CNPT3]|uniref:hypothetical protein n=1 Tax=Psychromonas sp. CNPT3 TaxID=314282 RepID=UPI00006E9A5A|nr:hypothetical protein [Psychromonas sp. CNPT3]AGH82249.1 hypothetical protein PCNPT3_11565 [Psychromonas sp. CNPT3]
MFGRNSSDFEVVKRIDKIVYALMFIAFIFYFPTTLLPEVFLTKNAKTISSPTMQAIPDAHSMSVNTFIVPFFGCFKRYSASVYSRGNSIYSDHYWRRVFCEGFSLDYKLVKEGARLSVYYFKPISGQVELNSKIEKRMLFDADQTFSKLFEYRYARMLKDKKKG